ncbi:membrane protein insertase YidC [Isoalcanivorax indicus]|uniref:membrane protein insertase YidC n=1 Tax=Isoalcanivorax indicus TaxID=2202653 RepID=UPI000DB94A67|nr:membrane protein insertase YidC [Isoalcanivorax indicus]
MEIQRALILTAIAVVTYLMILAWQEDYGRVPEMDQTTVTRDADSAFPGEQDLAAAEAGNAGGTATNGNGDDAVPSVEEAPRAAAVGDIPASGEQAPAATDERLISVRTDIMELEIDRLGGDIVRIALLDYPRQVDTPDQPFVLLERSSARTYVAQSGIVGANGTDSAEGRPTWQAERAEYRLGENDQELNVDLYLRQENGAEIIKRFTFERGSYLIRHSHIVRNNTNDIWQGALYGQIKRDGSADPGKQSAGFIPMPTYLGGAYWTSDKPYNKLTLSNMRDENLRTTQEGGWIAMIQHYFLSAWVPDPAERHTYSSVYRRSQDEYILRFVSPTTTVAPNSEGVLYTEFYAGPKLQDNLRAISPGLHMTVDYGWLWFIAQPIFAVLVFLQSGQITLFGNQFDVGFGVGNWGIAIILLTLLIKLVFFKLSATSYRSMARMRKVAPEMQRIREQNKNDRQKQSMELMKLYQKEKINPLGGCLPILVQMPVFIALYYVLLESVELRQAPFFGWIQDLSIMDPWFILPLLMGASMWFQMRLNPTPPDPTQAQVMKWMPIIFTVFFLWFPAGLVLYWLTNNILSIAQQWFITRRIENE